MENTFHGFYDEIYNKHAGFTQYYNEEECSDIAERYVNKSTIEDIKADYPVWVAHIGYHMPGIQKIVKIYLQKAAERYNIKLNFNVL